MVDRLLLHPLYRKTVGHQGSKTCCSGVRKEVIREYLKNTFRHRKKIKNLSKSFVINKKAFTFAARFD